MIIHQQRLRGAGDRPSEREGSPERVPAAMPGRISESSAGPGRCVRGEGATRKSWAAALPPSTYRPRNHGHETCLRNSRLDEILSRFLSFRDVRCHFLFLLRRPNGSYRFGTDSPLPSKCRFCLRISTFLFTETLDKVKC